MCNHHHNRNWSCDNCYRSMADDAIDGFYILFLIIGIPFLLFVVIGLIDFYINGSGS